MNNKQDISGRLCGVLGMARRSGRLTTGFDAVSALIAADKEVLVLLAADLSKKTEKELRYAARNSETEILVIPLGKDEISGALGLRKPVGVLAVEDKGFADSVRTLGSRHMGDSKEEGSVC